MQITVTIGESLQRALGTDTATKTVIIESASGMDAIVAAARAWPGLGGRILNCDGALRRVVRLLRSGVEIEPGVRLQEGEELLLTTG